MQLYECLGACAVVAAATGALTGLCARLHMRPFEIGFAGALVLAMSRFSFAPIAEFRCNPAVLCLPAYLLLLSASRRRPSRAGGRARCALFLAAAVPAACSLAATVAELIQTEYASVNLSGNALCNGQAILCATVFFALQLGAVLRKRKRGAA